MQKRGYKDLIVWQKAMELVTRVYALVRDFPREELFGITSQIKRAAISIPANIAEGSGRRTEKDFRHFMTIAYGSAIELETHLLLSKRLDFGKEMKYKELESLHEEVLKILHKMHLNTKD